MIADLKPYPDYKDSGEPWLPERPSHWPMVKLKRVLAERSEKEHPDEPLLAATQTKGVVLKTDYENRTVEAMKDLHNLKLVLPGDFVISLRSFQGGIEYARCRGIISPAYTILYPRETSVHGYLAALFKSRPFVDNLTLYVTGIRQGQNIDYTKLSNSYFPVPPPDDRIAIVRFLAALDRRVNRFVRAKRRLIELLTEQKQAIITQAVTRGLNPNAKLKPSGKAWVPEIPAEWSIVPMRRVITRAVDGPHHSPPYVDEGVMFISARNVKVDEWSLGDAKYITQADYDEFSRRIRPEVGDVLYTKGGTTGVARAVDLTFPFQVWVHIAVLKLRRNVIEPEYLALALNSTPCYEQAQLYTRGATNQDLGLGRMKGIEVPLPPTLAEQNAIVGYANTATTALRRSIRDANREIDLIREYRTRLVADVVTGKLDVRAAAARLPEDETDASEPLDAVATDAGDGLAEDDALGDEGAREGADETLAALE